jgi:hypothetical protein
MRGHFAGRILLIALAALAPATVQAQLEPGLPQCIPAQGNAPVFLTVEPPPAFTFARVYFQAAGKTDLYFLELRQSGPGAFWAVLPKPEVDTTAVEITFVIIGPDGTELRSETATVQVTDPCEVALTPQQQLAADSLVVGETTTAQQDERVIGFLCDGILGRFGVDEKARVDEVCREVIAGGHLWWIPVAALGSIGAIASIDDCPECPPCPEPSPCVPCEP